MTLDATVSLWLGNLSLSVCLLCSPLWESLSALWIHKGTMLSSHGLLLASLDLTYFLGS